MIFKRILMCIFAVIWFPFAFIGMLLSFMMYLVGCPIYYILYGSNDNWFDKCFFITDYVIGEIPDKVKDIIGLEKASY